MTRSEQIPFDIPSSLAPFFQEYDLAQLDVERSAATIIERTLRFGNREELRWLFRSYPRTMIINWVEEWGHFVLPKPHLAFSRLVLDLESYEKERAHFSGVKETPACPGGSILG